jgi:ribokinase
MERLAVTDSPRLAVIGSLNMDVSVAVRRLPGPGETVLGSGAVIGPGGKGANQAVAAARLGGMVRMAGCTGDDEFGARIRAALAAEKVDIGGVRAVPGSISGLALITIGEAGENTIAVAPGANSMAGDPEIAAALAGACDLLVASAEIPAAALSSVLAAARTRQVPCLLNLAPAPGDAAALLRGGVDWLVVNESEAAAILGRAVSGLADAGRAARDLGELGAVRAVVTAGPRGAALAEPAGSQAIAGFRVASIDSAGAGDAFVGALAVALAAGLPAGPAVRAACAAGATAATRRGVQDALPSPPQILAATGLSWPAVSFRRAATGQDYGPGRAPEGGTRSS